MSKTLQKVFKLLKNGGDSTYIQEQVVKKKIVMNATEEILNDGVSKNLKIDNEKKKLIDKLRTIRKIKTKEWNRLVIAEAEIKSLRQKKSRVIGPILQNYEICKESR